MNRPLDEGDWNLAYLFPDEVAEARARTGLVVLPVAPIEWHGPHLAMGCDPLLAHAFARRLARELASPYFPPLFIGTERERRPAVLRSLGFTGMEFIEGMDFPTNSVKSAYVREEVFSVTVRATLDALFDRMGFRFVVIVNGHGADNQREVLDRLVAEYNSDGRTRLMWVYAGFPRSLVGGAIGHASAEESSMLSATWPHCVDLQRLPADGPLRNIDHAVVDGDTFDGAPTADFTVRAQQDPRRHTDAAIGGAYIEDAAREAVAEIRRAFFPIPVMKADDRRIEASPQCVTNLVAGNLRAVIGDNSPLGGHLGGYNGVFRLESGTGGESPFVEKYAGLNLEHYFDARPRSDEDIWFEPRTAPMTLRRINDRTAELYQPTTTCFGVESWTRFELTAPHYIDMQFRCVPQRDVFRGGFLGVFWASYIREPEDKSIYFLQEGSTPAAPRWVQFCTQKHGCASTVRRAADGLELPFEEPTDLLYANLSPLHYHAPFFYGRWRDRVLIYMFRPGPVVRFAHSPSGGGPTTSGDDTSPAWDFQLIIPECQVGQEYRLEMRLVFKKWAGRADVIAEARAYLSLIKSVI